MNANEYVDYRVPQQLFIYEQHWYPEDLEYIREYVFRSGWRLTVNPEDHADARVMDALTRRIQEAHRSGLPRAWQCLEYQSFETPEEDYDEERGDGVCPDEGCLRRFREREAAARPVSILHDHPTDGDGPDDPPPATPGAAAQPA